MLVLILSYIIALVLGATAGYFISQKFSSPTEKKNQLLRELQNKTVSFDLYHQQVEEHLEHTSKLLSQLAQHQHSLEEHFNKTIERLAQKNPTPPAPPLPSQVAETVPESSAAPSYQAPKDYAPPSAAKQES